MLDLQAVDTAIAQLRHRRATLPEHGQLARLEDERSAASADLVAAETRVSDLEVAQRQAESDLEPVRQRRVRNQQRIDDGSVADAKALTGLVEEIQHLERRINDLEDAELELMEQLENAAAERDDLAARNAELEGRIGEVVARRDEQLAVIDGELAANAEERSAIAADLPEPLVATYDKLRTSHGGVGAAELRNRRCTGCQLEVNAADLRTFAAAPDDEVLRCEECGRILVRTINSGL
ncbi:MAG TPA: C4-type zinc ribbon domain-containing protein [Segeticoccus sp.]|uniref:zinc ribbon domain-containing protein n=1 Tax=Segeticoccus sp. TaxID=2706531 RepID=UPI002D7E1B58|nr:C4-type zinc ribbon domain-containing protein [Segeticoccus sp.]HET8600671.1 C4-type zinc ribbon domain-containing protein [Segeticoccus sp.]